MVIWLVHVGKNIHTLYDLEMEDPTVVRERVRELVDEDDDCFAARKLDDVNLTFWCGKSLIRC